MTPTWQEGKREKRDRVGRTFAKANALEVRTRPRELIMPDFFCPPVSVLLLSVYNNIYIYVLQIKRQETAVFFLNWTVHYKAVISAPESL